MLRTKPILPVWNIRCLPSSRVTDVCVPIRVTGLTVIVKPRNDGCATIFDKDFWIFGTSQLVEAINRSRADTRPAIRFTAYEFLVATNRSTTGVGGINA